LRFANPSPPSGWIKDFHLQTVDHARHTPEEHREAMRLERWPHRMDSRRSFETPRKKRGSSG
jgi:hypothetical protein